MGYVIYCIEEYFFPVWKKIGQKQIEVRYLSVTPFFNCMGMKGTKGTTAEIGNFPYIFSIGTLQNMQRTVTFVERYRTLRLLPLWGGFLYGKNGVLCAYTRLFLFFKV